MIFPSNTVCFYGLPAALLPCPFQDLRSRVTWSVSRALIGRNGSREQIDDVSHANEAADPKTIAPLSFLRSDWLLPIVSILTTNDDKQTVARKLNWYCYCKSCIACITNRLVSYLLADNSLICTAVTKVSSCRENTTSRRGIKQLGISFGLIFVLFSYESSQGPHS